MDRSEDQSHITTWHNLNRLKTPYSKEYAGLSASCRTEAWLRARIIIRVSSSVPNHTPHNPETVMTNARLYRVNLFHP